MLHRWQRTLDRNLLTQKAELLLPPLLCDHQYKLNELRQLETTIQLQFIYKKII
jgi:hypothetical protein